jgi:hypothetical protein
LSDEIASVNTAHPADRLAVDRRRGQVGGKEGLAAVDRCLNFLRGHVELEAEVELEHDDRHGAGAGRGHLGQALHLAKLALQRGRNRGCCYVRTGPRIERDHLDGGIVHLRQRGNGQLQESDNADQQNGSHQERRRHRPHDEGARRIH